MLLRFSVQFLIIYNYLLYFLHFSKSRLLPFRFVFVSYVAVLYFMQVNFLNKLLAFSWLNV